jgi:hypothetical protein
MKHSTDTYFLAFIIVIIIIIIILVGRISDSGKSLWVEDFNGLL